MGVIKVNFNIAVRRNRSPYVAFLLGLFFIIVGTMRWLYKPTLPSYRILEVGMALTFGGASLISVPHVWDKVKNLLEIRFRLLGEIILQIDSKFFLLSTIIFAFLYRCIWFVFSSVPMGSDTYKYMKLLEMMHDDPLCILSVKGGYDILPMIILWLFFELFSFRFIYTVLIPMFSALSIIPFYMISRHFYGDGFQTRLATILFSFSTLHMRLVLDLYRQVIAYFFALLAFYFIITDRPKFPIKTYLAISAMWLSHQAIATFFFLSTIVYIWLTKDRSLLTKLVKVIIACLLTGTSLMFYIRVANWLKPNRLSIFIEQISNPMFLSPTMQEYFYNKLHLTFELFEWVFWLTVLSIIFILRSKELKNYIFFLVLFLTTLFLVVQALWPIIWPEPDRWGLTLDIPCCVFAAALMEKYVKKSLSLLCCILILLIIIDSLTFSFVYLSPH